MCAQGNHHFLPSVHHMKAALQGRTAVSMDGRILPPCMNSRKELDTCQGAQPQFVSFLEGSVPLSGLATHRFVYPHITVHHCCAFPILFQGFWEERLLRLRSQHQALGPAILVFGCRSTASDYLFQQTLDEMVQSGSISKVLVAFSREPGLPKTYVQVGSGRG